MRPKEDIILIAKESAGISIENTSTGCDPLIAACSATFMTKVVLPIDGRPATITKSDRCNPEVNVSKSVNPVERPVIELPLWYKASIRSTARPRTDFIGSGPPSLAV